MTQTCEPLQRHPTKIANPLAETTYPAAPIAIPGRETPSKSRTLSQKPPAAALATLGPPPCAVRKTVQGQSGERTGAFCALCCPLGWEEGWGVGRTDGRTDGRLRRPLGEPTKTKCWIQLVDSIFLIKNCEPLQRNRTKIANPLAETTYPAAPIAIPCRETPPKYT